MFENKPKLYLFKTTDFWTGQSIYSVPIDINKKINMYRYNQIIYLQFNKNNKRVYNIKHIEPNSNIVDLNKEGEERKFIYKSSSSSSSFYFSLISLDNIKPLFFMIL